jgi:hypothetical protein
VEKKINNQKSFLWKMVFTIKFCTLQNIGNNFKISKKPQKISGNKLIKKPCVHAESVCAACSRNHM